MTAPLRSEQTNRLHSPDGKRRIVEAIKTNPQVTFLDLTPEICDAIACRPVRGKCLVYRDDKHLTATFSRLLADEIESLLP
jgi:hypothetical protein